ncbi:MAG: hypothetical protein JO154_13395 [Chitinophaga sp.]|uniref:hypothetical protein n=1 Tax=Chitinophaga sp. TaxID=1869181 RepID=UPI0025C08E08|nr:hypothetical protein [Chitinophaga sp.]MBV8253596.1 hypothetical protein [Chitinophaga sp.]
MKTPKALVLGSLVLMSVLYACKKNDSAPVPGKTDAKWSGETMKVKLQLNGELQTSESPLGRQASNARINPDSTIYAVDIRLAGYYPFAQGIFTKPDSMYLTLPKGTYYTIRVAAIKWGSAQGLYETVDSVTGGRFLPGTPLNRYITNRLSMDSTGPNQLKYQFLDSLSYFAVATSQYTYETYRNSELDTYYGTYQGSPKDSQLVSLTIPLKRITYGIRFQPENFSDGNLMIDYGWKSAPKTLPVGSLSVLTFTYTVNDFAYGDNVMDPVPVTLKWVRPNGSITNLGGVTINPKRNTLTTVRITAPASGVPLGISIAENTWRTDTTVVVK